MDECRLALAEFDKWREVDKNIKTLLMEVGKIDQSALKVVFAAMILAWQAAWSRRTQSGWLPIETAPRDGSRFLFTNGEMVGTGHYINSCFAADSWQGAKNTVPVAWMPLPDLPGDGA